MCLALCSDRVLQARAHPHEGRRGWCASRLRIQSPPQPSSRKSRGYMEPFTVRAARPEDIEAMYHVRASTRQNPIAKAKLMEWGITPESFASGLADQTIISHVCDASGAVVGFCNASPPTGEVLVLAVLAKFERKGLGLQLLRETINQLRTLGCGKIWLAADPKPEIRAHGFYRANGWIPNGTVNEMGDEILIYVD